MSGVEDVKRTERKAGVSARNLGTDRSNIIFRGGASFAKLRGIWSSEGPDRCRERKKLEISVYVDGLVCKAPTSSCTSTNSSYTRELQLNLILFNACATSNVILLFRK